MSWCRGCHTEFQSAEFRRWCPECWKEQRKRWSEECRNIDCVICSAEIDPCGGRKYCNSCADGPEVTKLRRKKYANLNDNERARKLTKYAVKIGFLPDPTEFDCMDCGKSAECYDHRDYHKPLEVDPVCLPCNASRGRGIPFKAPLKLVKSA